jgi:hypothetical protein
MSHCTIYNINVAVYVADPDLLGHVRILGLRNNPISTFLCILKCHEFGRNPHYLALCLTNKFLDPISSKQILQHMIGKKLIISSS